jgi:2,6-dihydroxypyridine 3-monooxygenase
LVVDVNPRVPLGGRTAVILGGSNGGLSAALALAHKGMHVKIRERAADPYAGGLRLDDPMAAFAEPRGGALMLRPETRALYRQWGVVSEPGVFIQSRVQDRNGKLVSMAAPMAESATWDGLARSLRRAGEQFGDRFEYEGDKAARRLYADEVAPVVSYEYGKSEVPHVIVDATGEDSTIGDEYFDDPAREYVGYMVWRGEAPMDAFDREIRDITHKSLHEILRPGRGINMFPVLRETPDGPRQMLTWAMCLPDGEEALREMLGSSRMRKGFVPQGAVPDVAIEHIIRAAHSTGKDSDFPPWVRRLVEHSKNEYFGRIVKDLPGHTLTKTLVAPGLVCVGQRRGATSRPFSARSTALAAQDAQVLAESLAAGSLAGESRQSSLESFDATRLPVKHEAVERVRELDKTIALPSPGRSPASRRRAFFDLRNPIDSGGVRARRRMTQTSMFGSERREPVAEPEVVGWGGQVTPGAEPDPSWRTSRGGAGGLQRREDADSEGRSRTRRRRMDDRRRANGQPSPAPTRFSEAASEWLDSQRSPWGSAEPNAMPERPGPQLLPEEVQPSRVTANRPSPFTVIPEVPVMRPARSSADAMQRLVEVIAELASEGDDSRRERLVQLAAWIATVPPGFDLPPLSERPEFAAGAEPLDSPLPGTSAANPESEARQKRNLDFDLDL